MKISFVILSLFLAACSSTPPKVPDEGAKLNAIITNYTQAVKRLDPYQAPYFNIEEDLNKFGDYMSPESFERDKSLLRKTLEELKTVDVSKLSPADATAYKLFKPNLELELRSYDFPKEVLSFNQMGNRVRSFIDSANSDLSNFPFKTVKNYEAFTERAKGFGPFLDRMTTVLKRGIQDKITLSCVVAGKTVNSYKDALESSPEKNPFFKPVPKMPTTFAAADRERITQDFKKMITEDIVPPLKRFDHFFRNEYSKHCRKEFGIGKLPMGKEWYQFAIEVGAESKLDAKAIHDLGLSEVKRIESEIATIQKKMGYKGTVKDFLRKIVKDPNSYFKSSGELLAAFESQRSEIAKKIPQYFSMVPKSDYRIVESTNPEDAAGSYRGPTETRPEGRFVVASKNLKSVSRFGVTTLLMHEAVPGHHFQIALAYDQKDRLSEFQRKLFDSTAFVEGWALYAEYLGREMELYDDYQKLGNLAAEQMRAVRLVVDTGIHAMGWDQKRTLKFMRDHMANDERDNEIEANRYSVWPGQALAYKIGQLKILELRKLAEKELGPKFDIREFHRVVIGDGALSLSVLEEKVKAWIQAART